MIWTLQLSPVFRDMPHFHLNPNLLSIVNTLRESGILCHDQCCKILAKGSVRSIGEDGANCIHIESLIW